jgi:hypothetical protein
MAGIIVPTVLAIGRRRDAEQAAYVGDRVVAGGDLVISQNKCLPHIRHDDSSQHTGGIHRFQGRRIGSDRLQCVRDTGDHDIGCRIHGRSYSRAGTAHGQVASTASLANTAP